MSDAGVEVPVTSSRVTRSTGRTLRNTSGSSLAPAEEIDGNRDKWVAPMVYPRTGKNRAEVGVEDRDRLRGTEFLNDNLIGFYLRFLQDHLQRTNKDAAKRVYFFNSYFFDTLSNTPRGRGINYDGVAKWTRNIDLFSYDYVVVPINQNAHWYLAIICNLPNLNFSSASSMDHSSTPVSDKASVQTDREVQVILESPEPEPIPAAAMTAENVAQVREDDPEGERKEVIAETPEPELVPTAPITAEQVAQVHEDDKEEKHNEATDPSSSEASNEQSQEVNTPAHESPNEQKSTSPNSNLSGLHCGQTDPTKTTDQPTVPDQKNELIGPVSPPSQPAIVTFDSLGFARFATIRLLREYICQEATAKRNGVAVGKDIKGIRATEMPLQPNDCDCGLYLLAYMEKFVQNPDAFITPFLRRDKNKRDWPPLESSVLRFRLRKFLDDMYEEQKQEGQSTMADQKIISILLGPPLPSHDDDGDDKDNGQV